MKVTEMADGMVVRKILLGMITDDTLLARVGSHWSKRGLFPAHLRHANLIGDWCVKHHRRYGVAPGEDIRALYAAWASTDQADEVTARMVDEVLAGVGQEEEDPNSSYTVDLAGDYFNRVRLIELAEQIKGDALAGRTAEAESKRASFHRIEMGVGSGVDFLADRDSWRDLFTGDYRESLVDWCDRGLNSFFDGVLCQEDFVSFLAPNKTGKTYWMMRLAFLAAIQGRRVAFFSVGDLSEKQTKARFAVQVTERLLRAPSWPHTVKWPVKIDPPQGDEVAATVTCRDRVFKDALCMKEASKALRDLKRGTGSKNSKLRISCHPNLTIGADGIMSVLQTWELDGWGTPDIVVIDYADLLTCPAGFEREIKRDQVNASWQMMRQMAQKLHCLVVTATQADAQSFDAPLISRRHFSEDNRKLAHVTAMIGLNVNGQEKEAGVTRLNKVVLREGENSHLRCLHVAGCLALANPAVVSTY